jgi:transaldolase
MWWHDSGEYNEVNAGFERMAYGVTTNPVLSARAIKANKDIWEEPIREALKIEDAGERAEALMKIVVTNASEKFQPIHKMTNGKAGYVCAQVNPAKAGEREEMMAMARRFNSWAPNIAVKLPVTGAGLDTLETCISEGITVTATVSFTVPQVVQIAESHRKGIEEAKKKGIEPGHCFAVIMIGRIDDYLTEVAHDNKADVREDDLTKVGLAITKRAYSIYKEKNYEAILLVAALRGTYHMTELAGADLIMSIHPKFQGSFLSTDLPKEKRIDAEISPDVIKRLSTISEFVRAYEPDGMSREEFVRYGVTQRTLSQFSEIGWKQLEAFTM